MRRHPVDNGQPEEAEASRRDSAALSPADRNRGFRRVDPGIPSEDSFSRSDFAEDGRGMYDPWGSGGFLRRDDASRER